VRFEVPTTRLAFTDAQYRRIVEPGEIELWVGPSCAERETAASITITGPVHPVTNEDERYVLTEVISRSVRARTAPTGDRESVLGA
jgi:hypothetical protein